MELENQNQSQNQQNKFDYNFDLSYFKENMMIESTVKDGVILNWDHLEKLWEYSLISSLKVDPKETPVLMAEKSYNSSISRQK